MKSFSKFAFIALFISAGAVALALSYFVFNFLSSLNNKPETNFINSFQIESSSCLENEAFDADYRICLPVCDDGCPSIQNNIGDMIRIANDNKAEFSTDGNVANKRKISSYVIDSNNFDLRSQRLYTTLEKKKTSIEQVASQRNAWKRLSEIMLPDQRKSIEELYFYQEKTDQTALLFDKIDKDKNQLWLNHNFLIDFENRIVEENLDVTVISFTGLYLMNYDYYTIFSEMYPYSTEIKPVEFKGTFVSSKARNSVQADFIDSFTNFVLRNKPLGGSIADEKVRFFYDYPELINLRDYLRGRLFNK